MSYDHDPLESKLLRGEELISRIEKMYLKNILNEYEGGRGEGDEEDEESTADIIYSKKIKQLLELLNTNNNRLFTNKV